MRRRPLARRLLLGLVLAGCLAPATARAQAFCALRDPTRLIYSLFPEARSYRSVVKEVDAAVRARVRDSSAIELHRGELGRHTLYVALDEAGQKLGYVHARSEKGSWGLVEVAWALDPQLRVVDFDFQRCRSRRRAELEDPSFRRQLRGRDAAGLRALLTPDGRSLSEGVVVPENARELATTVIRCGFKTAEVTRIVWSDEVGSIGPAAPDAPDSGR